MRFPAGLLPLCLVACSTTPETANEPLDRCSVAECFNRHQVRDFEVVDDTSLVLYVGGQRCPFLVEFDGTFCDLTFLPGGQLFFRTTSIARPIDMRICSRDRHIGIDEGPFTAAAGGDVATPPGRLPCQIRDVSSLTDDQLLELYVENGIAAPPPPFGTGQIEVKGESEPAQESAQGGEAAEAAARETAQATSPAQ